jgi:hypothetical protein
MSLTATRTGNPANTIFLQDVSSSFAANTRGYSTLQQLVGNGYIEFGFNQNTADALSAAAGFTYAVYPHAVKNAMSALHLIAYGFCVRAHQDTNRIFVKLPANNAFVDTTVDYTPSIRMRIERAGDTINFYTISGSTATLRHSAISTTPLPTVADFILLSGRNGARITNVLISGVTQASPALDLAKNVYIPVQGYLNFSNIQPRLAVVMANAEDFTWHFPDGTTSKDTNPSKTLDLRDYTRLIRLEVPDGVTAIRELILPILTRTPQRYTSSDFSQITNLRKLTFVTGAIYTRDGNGQIDERRQILLTSQLRLPVSIQSLSFEALQEEVAAGGDGGFDMAPLLLPTDFNLSGLTNLTNLRLGFADDPQSLYQANFKAIGGFPNLAGCINLENVLITAWGDLIFYPEYAAFLNSFSGNRVAPFSYYASLANATKVTITHGIGNGDFDPEFTTSVIVNMAKAVDTRTDATPFTLDFTRVNGARETVRGTVLSLAANASAGANSIQVTAATGLNVGDRLLLQDGATNSLGTNLVIASIAGTASPFTVTFQAGQTLSNNYTTATGRVFNLESGIGSTQKMRLQGHVVLVEPASI